MSKLICTPFAFETEMNTGVNIGQKEKALETYFQNASVALVSAKHYNPECDVAFVTNLQTEQIPPEYQSLFSDKGVEIIHIPFDCFRFPKDMLWSLAFYKLCVMKHLCECDYDAVCYMDTDVYIQGSFGAIWKECEENVLLYDVNHGLNTRDYVVLCDEVVKFSGGGGLLTHYGGEFFAAKKERMIEFSKACEDIFDRMISRSFRTTKGDEFILSIAARMLRGQVKNASPYVYRFWTGAGFRLVSTCYRYNRIIVLHVPAEKEKGMKKLYERYIHKGIVPADRIVWKTLRLKNQPFIDRMIPIIKRILRK